MQGRSATKHLIKSHSRTKVSHLKNQIVSTLLDLHG